MLKSRRVRTAYLLLYALLPACTTITYKDGPVEFTRTSFGTQLQMSELSASIDKNGKRSIRLNGYVSDQVQAMERIAEGAARGAATAITP
jgi:hypothetical protein